MLEGSVVAVHQPNYLPYLGFFHKMNRADVFVLYDTAEYSKNGLTNRNRIKTANGVQWLTVPVQKASSRPIKDVEIASGVWAMKHAKSLQANYQRARYFSTYFPELKSILMREWANVSSLNAALIECLRRWLSIETTLVLASTLPPPQEDDATEKILHITQACGGSVYLSGPRGKDYLDTGKFRDIRLEYDVFHPRPYPQLHGAFIPNLSAVDALFNCGDGTRELLLSSRA